MRASQLHHAGQNEPGPNQSGPKSTGLDYLRDFARWGSGPAYVFPNGYRHARWSYDRVSTVARQFALELASRQIGKDDSVIIWGPNCAQWVAAFLGCAASGVVAVPLDDASTTDFALRISRQVQAKLVVCRNAGPNKRASVFADLPAGPPTLDLATLADAVSHHPAASFRAAPIQPSDTLEIVFTSGTTAEPKGVVITHGNVAANLAPLAKEMRNYLKYERLVHPLRFLNLLPLSHVFGQFLAIFIPPLMGATVIFEDTLTPAQIISTIRRERVSVLVAVPRLLNSLKQKIERDLEANTQPQSPRPQESAPPQTFSARYAAAAHQHFLRRWWTFRDIRRQFGWKFLAIISGGAALEPQTEEFWHRLGYAVIQGYGLTETTSLISLNHPFHTRRGSIGKVLPGRELKLADDGEILVRGSGVASGYWNGAALVPVAGETGWYATGDLGELDADGNLYFKGRKKDVIVTSAGMNVYPQDLEQALRSQPEVRDCVVMGIDRGGNAEPVAVLILRDPNADVKPADMKQADAKTVVARANATLAEYQHMRSWLIWPDEDFPRTSTGKPRHNAIRELVAARESSAAADPSADSPGNSLNAPLAELLAQVTGRAVPKLTANADLETDLGLTSLDRVELMGALEDRFQVDLTETRFSKVSTIADLDKLLRGEPAEKTSFHYPYWTLRWPARWVRLAAHYLLLRPAVLLLGWPRVVGRENLRGVQRPVLVVSNHIGDIDFGFIQTVLPARIRHRLATATGGEALEILRSPAPGRALFFRLYDRLQWTLGVLLLNLFPLPREAGFRKSFAYAGEAVDRGYSVLVFPEGRHTEDGHLRPFRTGVGLLVNNLRVPVVPIRIDGLFELKQAGKKIAPPGKIKVRIGKPLSFDSQLDPALIAAQIQEAVHDL